MKSALTKSKPVGALALAALALTGAGCNQPPSTQTPPPTSTSLDTNSAPLGVTSIPSPTSSSTATGTLQTGSPSTPPPTTSAVATSSAYKDGTYTAEGDYFSPGGPEQIQVTLTLKNGVITDSNVVPEATRGMSMRFQGMFTSGYKPLVIGKNIADINLLDAVSGSSLTPMGFNDAVTKIKTQAAS